MTTANDYGQSILTRLASGRGLETVKLQKLLYFIQGWSLASWDKPAFEEEIQAWKLGPVVPEVYKHHASKAFVGKDSDLGGSTDRLSQGENSLVDFVVANYGSVGAFDLADYTHEPNSPWFRATFPEGGQGAVFYAPIPQEDIKRYFLSEAKRIRNGGAFVPL